MSICVGFIPRSLFFEVVALSVYKDFVVELWSKS